MAALNSGYFQPKRQISNRAGRIISRKKSLSRMEPSRSSLGALNDKGGTKRKIPKRPGLKGP